MIFAIERNHCECYTLFPWPKLSRSKWSSAYLRSKSWKMQTLLLSSDRKSGICYRMGPLRMLHIVTWTYIFQVTSFEMWIPRSRETTAMLYSVTRYLCSTAVLHKLTSKVIGRGLIGLYNWILQRQCAIVNDKLNDLYNIQHAAKHYKLRMNTN